MVLCRSLGVATLVSFFVVGCSGYGGTPSQAPPSGPVAAVPPTATDTTIDGGAGPLALGFKPSNLPDLGAVVKTQDLVFSTSCSTFYTLDTDAGSIQCDADGSTLAPVFLTVTQTSPNPDGSPAKATVVAAPNIVIEPAVEVRVQGSAPLAFVASGRVSIGGRLRVRATSNAAVAGGFSAPQDTIVGGNGPGGGAPGVGGGAAGGTYCGLGGIGGGGAAAGQPAVPYGAARLVPLVGGSSGGNGSLVGLATPAGAGGGAVELVAGQLVEVLAQGHVNAGGGGAGGGGCGVNASGGGSGGAILVEAPKVTIAGALAANGGAGASVCAPETAIDGTDDASRAISSTSDEGNGGSGSGGPTRDGAPGTVGTQLGGDGAGGGGGGAGRIRVNAGAGGADFSGGVLSPDPSTGCASQGAITPA
jgi:hypothetical protein